MKKLFSAISRGVGRVQYNAPVVLTFSLLSFAALLIDMVLGGAANRLLFSVYRTSFADPLAYARVFLHVAGHSGFSHFFGNFLLILIVGPQVEEKYGPAATAAAIALTALATGLAHIAFSPGSAMLGASGVVFMLILLGSFAGASRGRIPLTTVLCVVFYIGRELAGQFAPPEGAVRVAYAAHVLGGVCGAGFGFWFNRDRIFGKTDPETSDPPDDSVMDLRGEGK
ncbi:MAG: rhomboid family intramembrane serine protease [Clostridiales bacterium]|jgi:membrane associated rhomboid family serine protease|nr:rhomboid family intramembrane serine protease [Clostridiales bacterium]